MVSRILVRCVAAASILSALILLLLQHISGAAHVLDAIHRAKQAKVSDVLRPAKPPSDPGDKVIVLAKLEREDTDWVAAHLPGWQRAIYTVDRYISSSSFQVPINKGHESMAYLTYIIDHYDTLPSTLVFLHSHRGGYSNYFTKSWHIDAAGFDNVASVRNLQLPFVQKNGYVNLRCNWAPGCKPRHRTNKHITPEIWDRFFLNTSSLSTAISPASIGTNTTSTATATVPPAPSLIGAACCAQFAVSSKQVKKRPKTDYMHFRDWVLETELNDAKSGRVMEFLWHIVFGEQAVYCPDPKQCYCDVYGKC